MSLHRLFYACLLALLLSIVAARFFATPAQADVAPPDPPYGSNPEPGSLTQVRMVSETVILEVDANSPSDTGAAKVTATFQMRNLGETSETLLVRFPLDLAFSWGNICERPSLQQAPINDLVAFVNGRQVATTQITQTIQLAEEYPPVTRPCWELFEVAFPPDEDVIIQVKYTAQPYAGVGGYGYSYILFTGAGWADTIGQANITLRLPYALDSFNFIHCSNDCRLTDKEIHWAYENFEPEGMVITALLLPPPLWQRILVERANLTRNPQDGEAWGRLAKAYKESIRQRRGFRSDATAMELYKLSEQAYQQALAHLPQDADWHYGYADLLCWNAEWNRFFTTEIEAWQACVNQIRQVLTIAPQHEATNALVQYFAQFENPRILSIEAGQIVYLILTPQPTATTTPSPIPSTPTPTATAPQPTLSPTPTKTLTPAIRPTELPTATPTNISEQSPRPVNQAFMLWLVAGLTLGGFILVAVLRRRS